MSNQDLSDHLDSLFKKGQQAALLDQAILAGNLELAKETLAAGSGTDGTGLLKSCPRPPALVTAIFFNPINRLRSGVTREWCLWMGINPDEYAQKTYSRLVEAPKPNKDFSEYPEMYETYPNFEMVKLLMQHGADPDAVWGDATIFIRVLNHEFLNDPHEFRYEEYRETLETLIDQLLPSVRKLDLNDMKETFPSHHPLLWEKIWNHVIHHQIEQPVLDRGTVLHIVQNSNNQDETLMQLISLKGLAWYHFEVLSRNYVLPSIKTLEFTIDETNECSTALANLLTAACERRLWLYAGDLIRLGAVPDLWKIAKDKLEILLSIYPKEHLNDDLLNAICRKYDGNTRDIFLNLALERGANPIPKMLNWGIVAKRNRDFRYILVLAQLANLDPTKTTQAAQGDPIFLFKRLPKDLQQQVVKVGFMAPSKNKTTGKFQAPSREHAASTYLKLKGKMPEIEEKVRVQRKINSVLGSLYASHKKLIHHSIPYNYRYGFTRRQRTGFYTLFHGRRTRALQEALGKAETVDQYQKIINHQLSFFNGEKAVVGDPYSFWDTRNYYRDSLTKKFKRYPVRNRFGYYGLLKKLKQETEAAIQSALKDDHPNRASGRA